MQVPPPPPPSDGTEQDFSKDSFSFVTLPRTGRSVSVTKAEIDADVSDVTYTLFIFGIIIFLTNFYMHLSPFLCLCLTYAD